MAIKTLRDKIHWIMTDNIRDETKLDRILRLIREDRKRHCAECLRVKNMIDAQIEKNRDEGAELQVRPSVYRDYRPYIRGRNGKSKI